MIRNIHLSMASACLVLAGNLFPAAVCSGQIYDRPIYSLSTHPNLVLKSIEKWEDRTLLHLELKNERIRASFCLTPDTYLLDAGGGETFRLISMEGIPACPEQHRFRAIGEVISFSLVFPPLPDEIRYLHLEEKSGANGVSLRYILLDEEMNQRISEGTRLYEQGKLNAARQVFEGLMAERDGNDAPVFGTLYLYLMYIHFENSDRKALRKVYEQLKSSEIPGKEEFIQSAKETGLVR